MTPFADDMSARGFFHVMGNSLEFPIIPKGTFFFIGNALRKGQNR